MWLKKSNQKMIGFHPTHILEDGSVNWEFHCGCCSGTREHFVLTSKENQELFQIINSMDRQPPMVENLLEEEVLPSLEKKVPSSRN